jgi:pimeloyl-ACP methyl ester carboxylesterase
VDHFAARFTVVTVDLAATAVGKPIDEVDHARLRSDVAAVVTGLDLPKVVLVGHSMAATSSSRRARRLRPRVRGLVWADVYRSLDESGVERGDRGGDRGVHQRRLKHFVRHRPSSAHRRADTTRTG